MNQPTLWYRVRTQGDQRFHIVADPNPSAAPCGVGRGRGWLESERIYIGNWIPNAKPPGNDKLDCWECVDAYEMFRHDLLDVWMEQQGFVTDRKLIKAWNLAHPDRQWATLFLSSVVAKHALNALRHGSTDIFTNAEWEDLKARYGYKCLNCWRREPHIKLTIDHVVPLQLGGSGAISNIQPLCGSCNSSKGTNTYDYRCQVRNKVNS